MFDANDNWNKSDEELGKSEEELNKYLTIIRQDTQKNDQIEEEILDELSNIRYKRTFFSFKPDEKILKNDNLSYLLQIHAGTAAYTSASLISARQEFEEYFNQKNEWYCKHQSIFSSSTGDYEFNDVLTEFHKMSPDPRIANIKPTRKKSISRIEIYERLSKKMQEYDSEFVAKLENSENSINNKEGGWIDNSVNSTVELIDRFIRSIAPNNQIKTQDWFIPNEKSKNGITRNHRVEFFLRQKYSTPDENVKRDIEYLGIELNHSIKKLQKLKHKGTSNNNEEDIIGTIDYARQNLLKIILYPE